MIFIRKLRGGIGNQMFQTAFAKVLGKMSGQDVQIEDISHDMYKENCNFITDDNSEAMYRKAKAGKLTGDYELWGFFQKAKFYKDHREFLIHEYGKEHLEGINKKDVVIHIRRGDYCDIDGGVNVLPLSYYEDILTSVEYNRPIVIGEGVDNEVIDTFRKYNAIITRWTPEMDMRLMQSAKMIIGSNSTFSWWGSFLSDAKVWQPVPIQGYFSKGHEHQKLTLPKKDYSRYSYVNV